MNDTYALVVEGQHIFTGTLLECHRERDAINREEICYRDIIICHISEIGYEIHSEGMEG